MHTWTVPAGWLTADGFYLALLQIKGEKFCDKGGSRLSFLNAKLPPVKKASQMSSFSSCSSSSTPKNPFEWRCRTFRAGKRCFKARESWVERWTFHNASVLERQPRSFALNCITKQIVFCSVIIVLSNSDVPCALPLQYIRQTFSCLSTSESWQKHTSDVDKLGISSIQIELRLFYPCSYTSLKRGSLSALTKISFRGLALKLQGPLLYVSSARLAIIL